MNQILLNDEKFSFSENDLPCLIHYSSGAGGSHFSVTMISDLFLSGSKILFLTAYPMAKDNFLQQVSEHEDKILIATQKDQLTIAKQAILIESGNQNLFLEALNRLDDIDERIVFIKNFEAFDDKIVLVVSNKQKLIISGDLDSSAIKNELLKTKYKTIIQFSKSSLLPTKNFLELKKYVGYFWQNDKNGLIKTIIN